MVITHPRLFSHRRLPTVRDRTGWACAGRVVSGDGVLLRVASSVLLLIVRGAHRAGRPGSGLQIAMAYRALGVRFRVVPPLLHPAPPLSFMPGATAPSPRSIFTVFFSAFLHASSISRHETFVGCYGPAGAPRVSAPLPLAKDETFVNFDTFRNLCYTRASARVPVS